VFKAEHRSRMIPAMLPRGPNVTVAISDNY
jgi:hypothetical protein